VAEPLKAIYNEAFLTAFAERVRRQWAAFDADRFCESVLGDGWESLELKGRIRRIALSLGAALPAEYPAALAILEEIADECRGFPYLFFPEFVACYGLNDWDRSIRALERFTALSSAEFAVRPFIRRDPERMMAQMRKWADHPDEHVRRLASEGCRPRLPWAEALPEFRRDPKPIIPILDRLKADPSAYVRKSVANNLNDISKDHPQRVLELAKMWYGRNERTDSVLRHGLRSLIRRAAHPEALALFGLSPDAGLSVEVETWDARPRELAIGGSVAVRYAVRHRGEEAAKLRLELAVDYPRAGGRSFRKLFKLAERTVEGGGRLAGERRHAFADLSTRRHLPGVHKLALLVNGREAAAVDVILSREGTEA
jgi:3-methyladenine DNA glycosylase AlkC